MYSKVPEALEGYTTYLLEDCVVRSSLEAEVVAVRTSRYVEAPRSEVEIIRIIRIIVGRTAVDIRVVVIVIIKTILIVIICLPTLNWMLISFVFV